MKTNKNGDPVAAVYDRRTREDRRSLIATTADSSLPNSRRIYVRGKLHPAIRVPFFVIPSEVENRAAREDARWTGRPKAKPVGTERIKSLDISVRL